MYRKTFGGGIGFEFGTAGRQDAEAPFKSEHSGTYPIEPVTAKALSWEEAGQPRFAFHVDHPGIRPRLIYRSVRSEILEHTLQDINTAFEEGINTLALEVALRGMALPFAIEKTGERLAAQAPGVKSVGQGPTRSASQAWTSEAQVVQGS